MKLKAKEIEYCKVCKEYDMKGHCQKGWKVFCNLDEFIPSQTISVFNFLEQLYDTNIVSPKVIDILANFVWEKERGNL